MTSLEQIWSAPDNEIDELLAIIHTGMNNINDRRIFLSKYYAKEGSLPDDEIQLLSFPEFKTLSQEMPIKDVKTKLSLNSELSNIFDELHLSSLTASFLTPGPPEKVAELIADCNWSTDENDERCDEFTENFKENSILLLKEFLVQNPELANVGLIGCNTGYVRKLLRKTKMTLHHMQHATRQKLNNFDVIAIRGNGEAVNYCSDVSLYKIIDQIKDCSIVIKSSNIFDVYELKDALREINYCYIFENILKLSWYKYTDPVTNEEKYMVIGDLDTKLG
jgi:hypothetical protein